MILSLSVEQVMIVVLCAGYKSWNVAGKARRSAPKYQVIWPNSLNTICQRNISFVVR